MINKYMDIEILKLYNNVDLFTQSCINLQKKGYTQVELAELSGVTRKTISKLMKEKGHTQTKQETSKIRGYYKKYNKVK